MPRSSALLLLTCGLAAWSVEIMAPLGGAEGRKEGRTNCGGQPTLPTEEASLLISGVRGRFKTSQKSMHVDDGVGWWFEFTVESPPRPPAR